MQVYALTVHRDLSIKPDLIVHLDMLNVLVALRIRAQQLQGKTVIINFDNLSVVHMLGSDKGRDPYMLGVACNIWTSTCTLFTSWVR